MTDLSKILNLIEQQGQSIEQFKNRVDSRLSKIDSLDSEVAEILKKQNRFGLVGNGGSFESAEDREHKTAFEGWARGTVGEQELRAFQKKSMSVGSDPDGGYLTPPEYSNRIDEILFDVSPIRRVARVVQCSASDFKQIVAKTHSGSGWVSELAARPATDSPTFAQVSVTPKEVYSNVAISQALLDDSMFNLGEWLTDEIGRAFGHAEGTAFITGGGVDEPRGFLDYAVASTDDGTRAFGTVQYIASGAAGAFATSAPADRLIDVVSKLKPEYRQNASWIMSASTIAEVRKIKNSNGDYLWRDEITTGQPPTLIGYPVIEAAAMPTIAANSLSIAFGDFKSGYTIADRVPGVRLLRDPYSSKPLVYFYCTRRVGGGLVNSEAIKLLKFAAS